MSDTIRYIISFLLYGHNEMVDKVAYCPVSDKYPNTPIIIAGNGMNEPLHLPDLSEPQVECLSDGRYIIHNDWIYNTFFFLSRAEEVLNSQRDQYGRFIAAFSILGKEERLLTPLIDTYSQCLCQLLHIETPTPCYSSIHLTHDVDTIEYYRHLRGAVGGILRGHLKAIKTSWKDLRNDPAYTFPWLQKLERPYSVIYFIKDTPGCGLDYPQYNLHGKDFQTFLDDTKASNVQYGWHSSAQARRLSTTHRSDIIDYTLHRSHYLNCSIERMQQLVEMGVKDDYTMAFADQAGFRLQTTRPVRWIHPITKHVTSLTLHPLTAMDVTLSNYMQLTEEEAIAYMQQLLSTTKHYHGEVNLLWHNTSIVDDSYHKSIYFQLLQLI